MNFRACVAVCLQFYVNAPPPALCPPPSLCVARALSGAGLYPDYIKFRLQLHTDLCVVVLVVLQTGGVYRSCLSLPYFNVKVKTMQINKYMFQLSLPN